jgi:hypothetical protein
MFNSFLTDVIIAVVVQANGLAFECPGNAPRDLYRSEAEYVAQEFP